MLGLRVILAWGVVIWPAWAAEQTFEFTTEMVNKPPPGFRSALTGAGQPGDWQVLLAELPSLIAPVSPKSPITSQRPVLAQLSRDKTEERFPLLIYEGGNYDDFTLVTRFKIVDGEVEQMAGVAFRIQDEKNYYYVRASALGTNLSFARMVNGQLADRVASNVEIPRGIWHELTVECRGNHIRGVLNGKELLQVTVTAGVGAFSSGKIGFWTKSDSVSYFADTRVSYQPKEIFAQVLVRETLTKYPRLLGLKIYAVTNSLAGPQIIASSDPSEVGQPAQEVVKDVLAQGVAYYGKDRSSALVTLPLHDRNGETIAAVKVVMKSFPGQTDKNALARALPIVKRMESRALAAKDLLQ